MTEKQLSVSEIDKLMAIFRGGQRSADKLAGVENLDLNSSVRIPKGIFETLTIRHEQAARSMTSALRILLRKDLRVELSGLEQDSCGNFKSSLPEPCCAFVVEMQPLRFPAYLVMDPGLMFSCLDRLLGGGGDSGGASARDLTVTEFTTLQDALTHVISAHVGVWSRYMQLTPKVLRAVSIPRFLRDVRATDPTLIASYTFSGMAEEAILRFAMPLPGLDAHLQYSRKEPAEVSAEKKAQVRQKMAGQIKDVRVSLSVALGRAKLSVREVLGLESGDVVVLDKKINEEQELLIEGKRKYRGYVQARSRDLVFRLGGLIPLEKDKE